MGCRTSLTDSGRHSHCDFRLGFFWSHSEINTFLAAGGRLGGEEWGGWERQSAGKKYTRIELCSLLVVSLTSLAICGRAAFPLFGDKDSVWGTGARQSEHKVSCCLAVDLASLHYSQQYLQGYKQNMDKSSQCSSSQYSSSKRYGVCLKPAFNWVKPFFFIHIYGELHFPAL